MAVGFAHAGKACVMGVFAEPVRPAICSSAGWLSCCRGWHSGTDSVLRKFELGNFFAELGDFVGEAIFDRRGRSISCVISDRFGRGGAIRVGLREVDTEICKSFLRVIVANFGAPVMARLV